MEQNENLSLGQRITKLRKQKAITQLQLAQELYVSDKTISKWENDEGSPSIDNLIELSKYFDVSIDYLLKGKEPEKEVVIISKLEFCAKNDDVNMLKQLTFRKGYFDTEDENGKSIAYYIVKYESEKLFKEIVEDIPTLHDVLMKQDGDLDLLDNASYMAIKNGYSLVGVNSSCIGEKTCTYMIKIIEKTGKSFDVLNKEEINRICSERIKNINERNKKHEPVTKKPEAVNDVVKRVLNYAAKIKCYKAFECILDEQIEEVKSLKPSYGYVNRFGGGGTTRRSSGIYSSTHGVIPTVCDDVINHFLDNGNFDIVRKINKLNKYGGGTVISEHDIEIKRQRLENILSEDEIKENEVVYDGILNLERLLATNDFPFIIKMLEKHPVNIIQLYDKLLNEENYREAFKIAVDIGDNKLAGVIKSRNRENIKKYIYENYWLNIENVYLAIRDKLLNNTQILDRYMYKRYDEISVFATWSPTRQRYNYDDVVRLYQYLANCMIEKAKLCLETSEKIKGLTKKHFEDELSKGNIDSVILGLYERVEAIIRFRNNKVEINENNIHVYFGTTPINHIKAMRDKIIENQDSFNQYAPYQIQQWIETVFKNYNCTM